MTTVFLSGNYYHSDSRYVNPGKPQLEFKKLEELSNWEYSGETYYFHINYMETSATIRDALSMEYISSYVDNTTGNLNKDKFRRYIASEMPTRIKEDVASGKCRYMIDHSCEGYWGIQWEYIQYIFSCKREDIIWLSGDFDSPDKTSDASCETHYSNWWERHCLEGIHHLGLNSIRDQQLQLIEEKVPRDKMCTYYNRRVRSHRITMMTIMHHNNLLDKAYWSWGGDVDGGMIWSASLKNYLLHPKAVGGWQYEKSYDIVSTWGSLQNGKPCTEDLQINLVNTINKEHILNTNFQFINETWATPGSTRFLSEKSFKPFMLMQPFITYGDVNTVQALRDHGYDVFDKWFDHGYDTEPNPLTRAEKVGAEIKRLQSFSSSEWTDMLYDMRDALRHNALNLEKANYRYCIDI